jgi:hypothetical protein
MAFWKSAAARRAEAAAAAGRKGKVMHQSLLQPVLLTWPFLLWGIIIIACYSMGIQQLASIAGPIATFNMVSLEETAGVCSESAGRQRAQHEKNTMRVCSLNQQQLWLRFHQLASLGSQ